MTETKKCPRAGFWISLSLAVFFFLCTILLSMSLFGVFLVKDSLIQGEAQADEDYAEVVLEGTGNNKIAIIPVNGVITLQANQSYFQEKLSIVESLKRQLRQAGEDDGVKAIILEVDSPGGGITASDVIYHAILAFKQKTKKPIIVSMQDVAASGGYYISVAADKIIAHPTTITGSIGVIMPLINIAALVEKYGIEDISITSGEMKNIASPFKKLPQKQKDILLEIVDEMHTRFVEVIAKGRTMPTATVRKLADGRVYTGAQALAAGLVDQLGYMSDAIETAKQLSGLERATIIKYEKLFTWSDIFLASARDLTDDRSIKINLAGTSINSDTPRFMYLWSGY